MFSPLSPSCRLGALALTLALLGVPGRADEPVRVSFDRALAHRPTPVAAPAVANPVADPLVAALLVPLRDGVQPAGVTLARANVSDPLADSFERMLGHPASTHVPPAPAGGEADPLIAAVVWPLLQARQYAVASAAVPTPN